MKITIPANASLKYVPGSTYYETNVVNNAVGAWVGGTVGDNANNESLLFVNDSADGVGMDLP